MLLKASQFLARVQDISPSFSAGQKMIAEYLLLNYDKAAFMTAARLGAVVGVSESTVVRFAYALGYDGYPQMQRALQDILKNRLTTVDRLQMTAQDNNDHVVDRVLRNDMSNIRLTLEEISRDDFNEAVSMIISARNIYIISLRSATALGYFLNFYLHLLLKNCRIISGAGTVFEQLTAISPEDLVIGISFPRYSRQTVEGLKYAKEKGATTLAISDSVMSPLAKHARVTLVAHSDMASFIDSFVAPLSVINALIIAVGTKESSRTEEALRQLEEIWRTFNIYYVDE
ncbi:MAG: MurR/RpiR family transcriptional regulator [Syntrophomonadaceae bacterium]|jgi:DNA-binding MurR/RpiR family transcriptional regulator|nr:MurR/RpiR family transcriptional regulator [Syntrophomonadaceae bacterium]